MRWGVAGCLLALGLGQPPGFAAADQRGVTRAEIDEQFRLGEQAWKASCPKPTEDGSCVALRAGAHRPRLIVLDRDPALAAEAQRRFQTVANLWRRLGGGELPGARPFSHPGQARSVHPSYGAIFAADTELASPPPTTGPPPAPTRPALAGAAHAAAGAAFYLAEAQWEELIRIEPPVDPGLLPRGEVDMVTGPPAFTWTPRLKRRFKAFILRKVDQLARTRRMYLALFARGEAPFDVSAAARIGQLYEATEDEIPTGQMEDKAAAAFERCLDLGAKRERYDEWFRLCEHELTALKPVEFPKLNELIPEATSAQSTITPIPVIPRL